MASASKGTTMVPVTKTVTVDEPVTVYTLVLTEEEAQMLLAIAGRFVSGPQSGIYHALSDNMPMTAMFQNNPFQVETRGSGEGIRPWRESNSLRLTDTREVADNG